MFRRKVIGIVASLLTVFAPADAKVISEARLLTLIRSFAS